jgi:hypothetical protein
MTDHTPEQRPQTRTINPDLPVTVTISQVVPGLCVYDASTDRTSQVQPAQDVPVLSFTGSPQHACELLGWVIETIRDGTPPRDPAGTPPAVR